MKIKVKLFASLREGRFTERIMECSPGMTVQEVLDGLEISSEEAAIIFVNNVHADLIQKLQDGDVAAFFPSIGGG